MSRKTPEVSRREASLREMDSLTCLVKERQRRLA